MKQLVDAAVRLRLCWKPPAKQEVLRLVINEEHLRAPASGAVPRLPSHLLCRWSLIFVFLGWAVAAGGCDRQEQAVRDGSPGAKPEAVFQSKPLSGWVRELSDRDVDVRRRAAKALGEMGPDGREALGVLEQSLAKVDEDVIVRFVAAVSIWELTGEVGRVMPTLLSMLRSDNLDLRYRGALVLEIIGKPAVAAVPDLRKVVEAYGKRDSSRLGYDEQLILTTATDALAKIQGRVK